jgi:hypothetical protein
MFRSVVGLMVCFTLATLIGCGGSANVVVTGQLHHKGELYKPAQGEQVMITFAEEKDGKLTGNTFPTRLDADGNFKIAGPNNDGIPAGKYRVGVTSMPEVPTPGQPMQDKFNGEYEMSKSPIHVDVNASNRNVKLEIP